MREAIGQNLAILDEGIALLSRLNDTGSASIERVGPHFRHCIDFYDCFFSGLAASRIDYDARQRASAIEASPRSAAEELKRLRRELVALPTPELERTVDILADTLPSQEAPTRSTVNRELVFLLSHTIHHYALIAMLLRQDGVEVPPDFGFAPSTLEHAQRED